MKDATLMKITAIASITLLEAINLAVLGIDGTVFNMVVGGICGLAGYEIGKRK